MSERDSKGRFLSGEANKGRPKGSTSKKTSEIRNQFQQLIEGNLDQLEDDLNSLKPKERLDVIMNLASYIIPKLKATEMTVEDLSPKTKFNPIVIDFTD